MGRGVDGMGSSNSHLRGITTSKSKEMLIFLIVVFQVNRMNWYHQMMDNTSIWKNVKRFLFIRKVPLPPSPPAPLLFSQFSFPSWPPFWQDWNAKILCFVEYLCTICWTSSSYTWGRCPYCPDLPPPWTSQSLTLPSTEDQEPSRLQYKGTAQRRTELG